MATFQEELDRDIRRGLTTRHRPGFDPHQAVWDGNDEEEDQEEEDYRLRLQRGPHYEHEYFW